MQMGTGAVSRHTRTYGMVLHNYHELLTVSLVVSSGTGRLVVFYWLGDGMDRFSIRRQTLPSVVQQLENCVQST